MNKADLLRDLELERVRLEGLVATVTPSCASTPTRAGHWSIKDITVHINYWQKTMVEKVQRVMGGDTSEVDCGPVDETNHLVYQENKDRPWHDVLSDFRMTHQRLHDMIADLPEAALQSPLPLPSEPDRKLIDFIVGESLAHYRDHLDDLRRELR